IHPESQPFRFAMSRGDERESPTEQRTRRWRVGRRLELPQLAASRRVVTVRGLGAYADHLGAAVRSDDEGGGKGFAEIAVARGPAVRIKIIPIGRAIGFPDR